MGKQSSNHKKLLFFVQQQGGVCPLCKGRLPSDITQVQLDHIVGRARGGTDDLWNLQAVHALCNQRKGDRPMPPEFAGLRDPYVQRFLREIATGASNLVEMNPAHVRAAWQAEAWKRYLAVCGTPSFISQEAFVRLPTWW